jgi:hypothetical protein
MSYDDEHNSRPFQGIVIGLAISLPVWFALLFLWTLNS